MRIPSNQRWQEQMASLFDPLSHLDPGERFSDDAGGLLP